MNSLTPAGLIQAGQVKSGKGYRDTLLWETIVRNCIKQDASTLLITANVRDFCESTGEIHSDLRKDLRLRNGVQDVLAFSRDLPTFTDTYIVPFLKKRKDFAVLVQNGKVSGLALPDVCDQNIDAFIQAVNDNPSVLMSDSDQHEPEVDVIDSPSDFQVQEASEVSDDVLLVEFECQSTVYFIYFLDRSDYFTMSDEETNDIAVLDTEWNDHVMRVESHTTVRFKCRLTFDSGKEEVESFEVESMNAPNEEA